MVKNLFCQVGCNLIVIIQVGLHHEVLLAKKQKLKKSNLLTRLYLRAKELNIMAAKDVQFGNEVRPKKWSVA